MRKTTMPMQPPKRNNSIRRMGSFNGSSSWLSLPVRYIVAMIFGALIMQMVIFYFGYNVINKNGNYDSNEDIMKGDDLNHIVDNINDNNVKKSRRRANYAAASDYFDESKLLFDTEANSRYDDISNSNNSTNGDSLELLPEKLFTIVGLESSGTTFMSKTIAFALGLNNGIFHADGYEGVGIGYSSNFIDKNYENQQPQGMEAKQQQQRYFTEVQHVSLPWGLNCRAEPKAYMSSIVPVVYPWLCMDLLRRGPASIHNRNRDREYWDKCKSELLIHNPTEIYSSKTDNEVITDDEDKGFRARQRLYERKRLQKENYLGNRRRVNKKTVFDEGYSLPDRYFLNISSHYEFYKTRNVDIHLIIVIRDETISKIARAGHCPLPKLAELEEKTGMKLINEAVENYILKSSNNDGASSSSTSTSLLLGSSNDGKVILVSYEMLSLLQYDYLKIIYNELGISSNYNPEWKDGNIKYVEGKGKNTKANRLEDRLRLRREQLNQRREERRNRFVDREQRGDVLVRYQDKNNNNNGNSNNNNIDNNSYYHNSNNLSPP